MGDKKLETRFGQLEDGIKTRLTLFKSYHGSASRKSLAVRLCRQGPMEVEQDGSFLNMILSTPFLVLGVHTELA